MENCCPIDRNREHLHFYLKNEVTRTLNNDSTLSGPQSDAITFRSRGN